MAASILGLRRLSLWVVAAALVLAGCDARAPAGSTPIGSFKAVDITGANYGKELNLTDSQGQRRSLADFKGKVTVLFFGYTQCPDVCPTTMVELAAVKQALGPAGEQVQGIFVTVDPERDTAEVLGPYVQNFSPDFVALRGTAEETALAAKQFKVFYAKVPGRDGAPYTMDHTAGSYIFDREGRLRLFTRYGSGAEALKHDLEQLLKSS